MMDSVEVSIARDSNSTVRIRLVDKKSRIEFVDVRMTLEGFASAITGLSFIEAPALFNGLEHVGKLKVSEARKVLCPLDTYDKTKLRAWLLENCQEDGWFVDSYLGSQRSVIRDAKGTWLNYSVTRYEERSQQEGKQS